VEAVFSIRKTVSGRLELESIEGSPGRWHLLGRRIWRRRSADAVRERQFRRYTFVCARIAIVTRARAAFSIRVGNRFRIVKSDVRTRVHMSQLRALSRFVKRRI
jgi:hypothetical protein